MDYEFDRKPLSSGTGSPLRRIAIFAAVLAVTGGILYWIIPHGTPKKSPAAVSVAPSTGKRSTVPEKGNATSTETKNSPAEASLTSAPKEVVETPAKGSAAAPTEKAVKGIPWQNDPVVDQAAKPVDAGQKESESRLSQENWSKVESGVAPWCVEHAVASGDNLERLANRYHTTTAAIKELNHLKSNTIFLGKKLKIVPGPWRIEISKSARRLQLFNLTNGKTLFAAYDVGIGRANSTPTEEFAISIRVYHPDYHAPNGAIYAYGEPENPMGDYFLKLAKASQKKHPLAGYGIHGSSDDAGVGRSLSHGCVRMRNDDVRQLYLLCPVGTAVSISE